MLFYVIVVSFNDTYDTNILSSQLTLVHPLLVYSDIASYIECNAM
jgi:hypothetical protein